MNKLIKKAAKDGFTLIELMIVVAIIGILAAIAIPKFADLITKSKESSAKGSLGSLRSAVSIYYSDNEGFFPSTTSLANALTTENKYMDTIPFITLPRPAEHANTNDITNTMADVGGWWYSGNRRGLVAVACTQVDNRGTTWSVW